MNYKKTKYSIKYIILILLISIPIFGHLDSLPIRIWDESRLAINASEMYKDGDFIVTHFLGKPDMWNTKPPLMIWTQVFFMHLIGVSSLAVRLPSAIAAFLTCISLLAFLRRYIDFWLGFITVMVLITSSGYVSLHGTRTGDYDALLTLFTTLYSLLFFAFCETKKTLYLYLFFGFCALAVLTKGIAGFLLIPGIVLFAVFRKELIQLFKNKHFYIGGLTLIFVVVGYYLLREFNNAGYLQSVSENELGGRYLATNEDHKETIYYYFLNIVNYRFDMWCLFIPCGILLGLNSKETKIKKLTLFTTIMSLSYFLIISTSQNRLEQYDMQLYPFMSILVAVFIYFIFLNLRKIDSNQNSFIIKLVPFLFLFLSIVNPYKNIIQQTYKPKETKKWAEFYELSYFLRDATKGKYNLKNKVLLYDGYDAHLTFYVDLLNDKGTNLKLKYWKEITSGDIVITHQKIIKDYIEDKHKFKLLESYGNVDIYQIF